MQTENLHLIRLSHCVLQMKCLSLRLTRIEILPDVNYVLVVIGQPKYLVKLSKNKQKRLEDTLLPEKHIFTARSWSCSLLARRSVGAECGRVAATLVQPTSTAHIVE